MEVLTIKNKRRTRKIHPQKFALWSAMASIIMMFAALTSAYIVRKAAGNWLEYQLPTIFYYSTVVILLSSVALHSSYLAYKKGNAVWYRLGLVIAFVLGVTFVVMQYLGWTSLYDIGVELNGNPSGSFFYLISGLHAAHVLGGIAILFVAMAHAFGLKFKVTNKRLIRFELSWQYWHFVDFLWIYLLIFLVIQ